MQRLGHCDGMRKKKKRLGVFDMWIWRRMECVKWTDKIKNVVVLEIVRKGRLMLEVKEEEKNLAGPLARKELPAEGCSRRNGKREEG